MWMELDEHRKKARAEIKKRSRERMRELDAQCWDYARRV